MVTFVVRPAEEDVFLALRVLYYYVVSLCLFILLCLSFVSWFSLLSPFLATMSLVGYFHVRFLLSAFPVCLFCLFSPTVFVPGLFCFGSVYLVTTAGFVADQLIM